MVAAFAEARDGVLDDCAADREGADLAGNLAVLRAVPFVADFAANFVASFTTILAAGLAALPVAGTADLTADLLADLTTDLTGGLTATFPAVLVATAVLEATLAATRPEPAALTVAVFEPVRFISHPRLPERLSLPARPCRSSSVFYGENLSFYHGPGHLEECCVALPLLLGVDAGGHQLFDLLARPATFQLPKRPAQFKCCLLAA